MQIGLMNVDLPKTHQGKHQGYGLVLPIPFEDTGVVGRTFRFVPKDTINLRDEYWKKLQALMGLFAEHQTLNTRHIRERLEHINLAYDLLAEHSTISRAEGERILVSFTQQLLRSGFPAKQRPTDAELEPMDRIIAGRIKAFFKEISFAEEVKVLQPTPALSR